MRITVRAVSAQLQCLKPFGKAVGMRALCLGERLEPLGQFLKAFFAGSFRHAGVHRGVLVGLPFDGRFEVGVSVANRHARRRVPALLDVVVGDDLVLLLAGEARVLGQRVAEARGQAIVGSMSARRAK